ncbi:MFS transporter [Salinarimonas soli]|uniref:MFS transporter n=1 Tax=Salinarimonas soli TaxID=1638099 RepID=A0A5B2VAF2_9HYPH|nr:MFS transporter [Salinarimonas soli]KAA2235430.1 MFS transporter [Salinarimonas soli]
MNGAGPGGAAAPAAEAVPQPGAFAPLRNRVFAVIWLATIFGNLGTFMRDVASAWLVVELSDSATAVALVQAAATLPIFLLAIPAGVLSDILDRRHLLLAVQVGLGAVSTALALLAWFGGHSVASIVGLTALGGIGAALSMPAWQAIVPELVPRGEVKAAVALNSLGINIARAVGPAAGGLILAAFGAAAAYGFDVLTYAVVAGALLWWPRAATPRDELSEHFGGALRAALRYARAAPDLRRILFRAFLFFTFASVLWALLPIVARDLLGGGPGFYGFLLGGVGAGAIVGAVLMPRLRGHLDTDGLVLAASLTTAGVAAGLALGPPQALAIVLSLCLGAAWIAVLTTLNATTQAVLPNWVRGRGLAIYLMVFNGASAAGSIGWGALAGAVGVPATLLAGAAGLALTALIAGRLKLPAGEADLGSSRHWPEPLVSQPVAGDRGPVLVTVTYRVRPSDRPAFLDALNRLAPERRRDGAYAWGVSEDAADPERLMEWFFVESWAEHLRQHHRVSHADADLQQAARRFHMDDEPPRVEHFLGVEREASAPPA